MKKRLFSIFLAVVMIATAINLAPVMEVMATAGEKMANQYSIYDEDSHWDSGQYYWNDGDYANTVAPYYDRANNKADENFKTRHVTMFADCDAHYNSKMDIGFTTDSIPIYQVEYTNTNTWTTNRGSSSTNAVKVDDQTDVTLGHTMNSSDVNNGWSKHTTDTKILPFLVYGYGCTVDYQKDITNGVGRTKWEDWAKDTWSTFYAPNTGDGDFRMAFRNYYNTDYVRYNPKGRYQNPDHNMQGLDIREYDWLEFDLIIYSTSEWKKTRSDDPASGYYVYLYSEPNCASDYYFDGEGADTCIEGYGTHWNWNFSNQLFNDDGSNKFTFGDWVTIRLPIRSQIQNSTSPQTVKQITIRMVGGNEANSKAVSVDDIRFVKNDDHLGKVYTHNGNGAKDPTNYPSGKYYMVNDFEYKENTASDTTGQAGFTQTFTQSTTSSAVPGTDKVIRWEESRADDELCRLDQNGTFNWAYASGNSNNGVSDNFYLSGPGIVTQGNYATSVSVRNNTYNGQAAGWYFPTYYDRHYDKEMDLSQYTHFSLDVYIRCIDTNGNGIQKPTSSSAQGVTFSLQLYDKSTVNNKQHDKFNYSKGYAVLFFLPFGENCYNEPNTLPDNENRFGKILPLGDQYKSFSNNGSVKYTDYGALRFTFTREELLASAEKSMTNKEDTLKNITGMRFLWLNRINYTDADGDNSYDAGETVHPGSSPFYSYPIESWVPNDDNDDKRYDIVLDNFIAYTPDTSITIQNQTDEADEALDPNQNFLYDVYGGYRSTDSANHYISNQLGNNVKEDAFTKHLDFTVSVPANGSATINNLPFNSYYISQQNWSWRYQVSNIIGEGDPYASEENKKMMQPYLPGSNTATILPRISLDGSQNRNVAIWELMKQRHFTVTFTQERKNKYWLNHNHAQADGFQTWKEGKNGGLDYTNIIPTQ